MQGKTKKRVFVCYSREDKHWFKPSSKYDLITWLEKALRDRVDLWHDLHLDRHARAWKAKIKSEIDRADAALLLISHNFVISSFIQEVELPRIRKIPSGFFLYTACSWPEVPGDYS